MNQPANTLESARTLTLIIYILQAAALFNGLTFLIAVIINYVKLDDIRGTWLESHFRWQIRTFWFALLWCAVGAITFLLVIGYFVLVAAAIWVIYRIVKGTLRLLENKEMYVTPLVTT